MTEFLMSPDSQATPIKVSKAFYIKLGRGGEWEGTSINNNIVRIGWQSVSLQLIKDESWKDIEQIIRAEAGSKSSGTTDFNALQIFCKSTSCDVWITFHASKLWWCRLLDEPIQEDEISKFRRVDGSWSDLNMQGERLLLSEIPGSLSQVQGYRGTLCRVSDTKVLERLIKGEPSESYQRCQVARQAFEDVLADAIRQLHWKDFEILVDLIFRQAGWRRVSVLGETMKYADLELQEPITGDRYQVQIKSRSTFSELEKYVKEFPKEEFRQLYFVVHTPDSTLSAADLSCYPYLKLVLPVKLAKMTIDSGLTNWLTSKVK